MAAPDSFMIGGDDEAAEGEMPAAPDAAMPDARTAAAKALMSALKSNDPAKFADAFEEMMANIDGAGDEEMPEEGMDEAPPTDGGAPPEMPF